MAISAKNGNLKIMSFCYFMELFETVFGICVKFPFWWVYPHGENIHFK
jgi:hypothetical protein